MDSKYKVTLILSEEQLDAMEAIIQQMKWDNVIRGNVFVILFVLEQAYS